MTMPIADKDVIKRIFNCFDDEDVKLALIEKDYPWCTINDTP